MGHYSARAKPNNGCVKNIMLALTKMLHWFVPYHPCSCRSHPPVDSCGNSDTHPDHHQQKGHWRAWLQNYGAIRIPDTLCMGFVYFTAVAATIVTKDHLDLTSDRYYVIMLVPVAHP
jgi:hypothetical protein